MNNTCRNMMNYKINICKKITPFLLKTTSLLSSILECSIKGNVYKPDQIPDFAFLLYKQNLYEK